MAMKQQTKKRTRARARHATWNAAEAERQTLALCAEEFEQSWGHPPFKEGGGGFARLLTSMVDADSRNKQDEDEARQIYDEARRTILRAIDSSGVVEFFRARPTGVGGDAARMLFELLQLRAQLRSCCPTIPTNRGVTGDPLSLPGLGWPPILRFQAAESRGSWRLPLLFGIGPCDPAKPHADRWAAAAIEAETPAQVIRKEEQGIRHILAALHKT